MDGMNRLLTKRLRIEPLKGAHAALLHPYLQDSAIHTYVPEDPPSSDELQRRYTFPEGGRSPDGEELWLNWVAFLGDSMTPAGTFQATLPKQKPGSFAYIIFPAFWRQGYAREMASCVISHLFQTYENTSLFAEIDTRNVASIRLVESLGLERVSTRHNADFFKGATSDEYKYSISRESWKVSPR